MALDPTSQARLAANCSTVATTSFAVESCQVTGSSLVRQRNICLRWKYDMLNMGPKHPFQLRFN